MIDKFKLRRKVLLVSCWWGLVLVGVILAARIGYPPDEFIQRRQRLMAQVKEGVILLFGEPMLQPGRHFRQDNDFFYFTGLEDPGAVLAMVPQAKKSYLFLPRQTEREILFEGPNLLQRPRAKTKLGLAEIYPVSYLDEFLARTLPRQGLCLYVRLQPRDEVDQARWETRIFVGRRHRLHYNDQLTLDNYRVQKLRERYPACVFKDVTPYIDRLRLIKTPAEIAILRHNGRISAEAIKQAMLATRPGAFEYELEAAALFVIFRHGARGFAYPPIVASGPNSCVMHYDRNDRRMKEGDLVLMDFGGDLDHMCIDITRTWPVSGAFTPEQKEAYRIVLAVLKACLEFYRPGITSRDVQAHVQSVLKKKGLDSRGLKGGIGHYVGLATHDVGPRGIPLEEGMVFAIEPALYYPEKGWGIRLEDTVLITAEGCEVLTAGVPKELEEVESLLKGRN
ncbi:MAG: aminopeptidase P N-terminal domain-containing protein [Candidatus Aminicenantes bacterium]|nr:aminopeptidase P N-terminal domain-containing protein [Candidatus Aminicenantes bacterium]